VSLKHMVRDHKLLAMDKDLKLVTSKIGSKLAVAAMDKHQHKRVNLCTQLLLQKLVLNQPLKS
jgi:hypothetical protein